MIYAYKNAYCATVYDGDARADMRDVMSIDTDAGIVESVIKPVKIGPDGNVVTEKTRFRSIYPIHGGSQMAQLFLCYCRVK